MDGSSPRAYLIGNLLRDGERAAAVGAGDERRAPRCRGLHEVGELAPERLFVGDLDLAAPNRRPRRAALLEPGQFDRPRGVVEPHVRRPHEEAGIPPAIPAETA